MVYSSCKEVSSYEGIMNQYLWNKYILCEGKSLYGKRFEPRSITVYRKLTHTERLLDQSSYNLTSRKATTMKTLTRRALLVCDTTDSLSDENKYLTVFSTRTTSTPTSLDETLTELRKLTGTLLLRLLRGFYNPTISV